MLALVIPVYRNEDSIPSLIDTLNRLAADVQASMDESMQVVFVIDGSPDNSYAELESRLPDAEFCSKLLLHSRNFGAFAAIRTGLRAADADYYAVMAADLQEPPELVLTFLRPLKEGRLDVVVGSRAGRDDPWLTKAASGAFWRLYRKLVIAEMPPGGVDVFGCNRMFRDRLLSLNEANTSLVGQLFWLGYRRGEVPYQRRPRESGKSAWTFRKKLNYLLDSVFSFTDLPIRLLAVFGVIGIVASVMIGSAVVVLRIRGDIVVPGYTPTVLAVMFFGGIQAVGLGIIGSYAWRAYENTKARPLALTLAEREFDGRGGRSAKPGMGRLS